MSAFARFLCCRRLEAQCVAVFGLDLTLFTRRLNDEYNYGRESRGRQVKQNWNTSIGAAVLMELMTISPAQQSQPFLPNLAGFGNPSGTVRTFSQNGDIDLNGPFF